MGKLRLDILDNDHHPVRYLLADGFCHVIQEDTAYTPMIAQFPSHFQTLIGKALEKQRTIGWFNATKGFLAKQEWAIMAQYDMDRCNRDQRKGEQRMRQITHALHAHIRRLWLSRNDALHSSKDSNTDSIWSAESAEILHYHSRSHLLESTISTIVTDHYPKY